jgi:hypothetical protein
MKDIRIILSLFIVTLFMASNTVLAQIPEREIQLQTAVLAAPEEMRENATVMGYSPDGTFQVLHEGTNDLICLSDDPESPGVNIACYHKALEPFMKRGRELRAEGKGRMEVFSIRDEEAAQGTLTMPEEPSTLYIFYGEDGIINWESGDVTGGKLRYVIYIPYATSETTGLPLKPIGPGAPWLMDAGTYRAHIMITP